MIVQSSLLLIWGSLSMKYANACIPEITVFMQNGSFFDSEKLPWAKQLAEGKKFPLEWKMGSGGGGNNSERNQDVDPKANQANSSVNPPPPITSPASAPPQTEKDEATEENDPETEAKTDEHETTTEAETETTAKEETSAGRDETSAKEETGVSRDETSATVEPGERVGCKCANGSSMDVFSRTDTSTQTEKRPWMALIIESENAHHICVAAVLNNKWLIGSKSACCGDDRPFGSRCTNTTHPNAYIVPKVPSSEDMDPWRARVNVSRIEIKGDLLLMEASLELRVTLYPKGSMYQSICLPNSTDLKPTFYVENNEPIIRLPNLNTRNMNNFQGQILGLMTVKKPDHTVVEDLTWHETFLTSFRNDTRKRYCGANAYGPRPYYQCKVPSSCDSFNYTQRNKQNVLKAIEQNHPVNPERNKYPIMDLVSGWSQVPNHSKAYLPVSSTPKEMVLGKVKHDAFGVCDTAIGDEPSEDWGYCNKDCMDETPKHEWLDTGVITMKKTDPNEFADFPFGYENQSRQISCPDGPMCLMMETRVNEYLLSWKGTTVGIFGNEGIPAFEASALPLCYGGGGILWDFNLDPPLKKAVVLAGVAGMPDHQLCEKPFDMNPRPDVAVTLPSYTHVNDPEILAWIKTTIQSGLC